MNRSLVGVALRAGLCVVVALAVPRIASAQDCETDVDCGHGFQCIHDSAGTSSVTGVGGSTAAECGDGLCDSTEDIESCPEDCDTIQYCAPAECTTDADCAEGFACGEEVGSNSSFTSAGGSSASICGDGICDSDETNESCPDDCRVWRECQLVPVVCETDADCADGLFCYRPGTDAGSSNVSVASVDSGSDGSDTDTGNTTTSGDAATATGGDGSDGGTGGDAAEAEPGFCSPDTGSDSSGNTSVGNSSTSGGEATGGGNETDAATASGSDGAGGSGAAANASSSASDNDGATSAGGTSSDDEAEGCSCSVPGAATPNSLLGWLAFGALAGAARRRRSR